MMAIGVIDKHRTKIVYKRQVEKLTVSVTNAAKAIGVDVNDVRSLVDLGYIRSLKLGSVKIPKSELQRFVDESLEHNTDWNEVLKPYRDKRKQALGK
jgi:hypothetical protein